MNPRKPSSFSPKKWTPEANMELLLAIIQTYNVKCNCEQIAEKLGDVTASAVRQQYNKLKSGVNGKLEKSVSGNKIKTDCKEESGDGEHWNGIKVES